MSVWDMIVVTGENKFRIAAVAIGLAMVAAVWVLLTPNTYTADVVILPPQQSQSAATALLGQLGALGGLVGGSSGALKSPSDVYLAILRSRTVGDAMVQRFGLQQQYKAKLPSEARADLEGVTKTKAGKDGLITVSVTDKSPARAAELANGFIQELRSVNDRLAVGEASERRLFFERQLGKAKEDLANAEVALKQTQEKTGLIQLDSQARAVIETVAGVRAQIAAREVELQRLRAYATDSNPDVVRLQQEIAGLRAELSKLEHQNNLGEGDLQIPTGKVPELGLEYIRRLRDVKYYETLFEQLARQYELAKIDEAREASIIQVLDPAVPPDRKSGPHRTLIVLGALFLGAILASFWYLFRAALDGVDPGSPEYRNLQRVRRALRLRRAV